LLARIALTYLVNEADWTRQQILSRFEQFKNEAQIDAAFPAAG
jgi:hypothetical protein